MTQLPDTGWVAVVKRDCPTCELTESVLATLAQATSLTVYTQDDLRLGQGGVAKAHRPGHPGRRPA